MDKFDLTIIGIPQEFGSLDYLNNHTFYNGKAFPNSYKDFVCHYGYGLALNEWLIYIPMGDYGDSWNVRSAEIRGTYYDDLISENIWFEIGDNHVDIIKRLIPFASSINGLYLFWDPESNHTGELDIYITDFRGIPFQKVAESLYDFIDSITNKVTFKDHFPYLINSLPRSFKCLYRK